MKKQILNIGKVLKRAEQKLINGGVFGSGCVLKVKYEDGSTATIPFEPSPGDPFATLACANHALQVAPKLVESCVSDCTHM